MSEFNDRFAVVTGASSGIGLKLTETLLGHGATVLAMARREGPPESLHAHSGKRLHWLAGNVTRERDLDALASRAASIGPVDYLVPNAGIAQLADGLDSLAFEQRGWKQAVKDAYTHTVSMDAHGSNMTYRDNYLDLDPTYKDAYGQPLLRMTFDWKDNEIRMSRYVTEHMRKIAEAMNPKAISVSVKNFGDHFNTRVYQTTHLLGGAIMGSDPKTSVLNRYLQSWDVHNVFVMGASAFPQGTGYNPTGLVAALAYWSAKAIREQYLKDPGPLVQA
ncbi:TPA: SDR family NAD(P)-dependent oxidoreductase [Pseudomonas aeruginosa]